MASALDEFAILMAYLLIIVALGISATKTLKLMVRLYQVQSLVLTIVVLITAFEPHRDLVALGLVAILPLTLAAIVPPLLARATYGGRATRRGERGAEPGTLGRARAARRQAAQQADLLWLQHGRSRLPVSLSAAIDMSLIAMAVLVAYRLKDLPSASVASSRVAVVSSLAVSIALLLQGLFTMINKNDIVSQIIGLLVVDQGLFLAAVRVAPPGLADLFVLSLFLYVLVTLTILVWVLPGLHRTASIEVARNAVLRG
jgi:hydrogenase-4 membrane subunit HyfE